MAPITANHFHKLREGIIRLENENRSFLIKPLPTEKVFETYEKLHNDIFDLLQWIKPALHTVPVSNALALLLLGSSTDKATYRFMRHAIIICNFSERFFILDHTMQHSWPLGSRKTICRISWPWTPLLLNNRRIVYSGFFILRKKVLHLLIQFS